MKQNIGIAARYARLVTGILALNYASAIPRKNHLGRSLMASLGAMKVAEGVIGWCPAVELCDRIFSNQGLENGSNDSNEKQKPNLKQAEQKKENNNDPEVKQSSEERSHTETEAF